MEKSTSFIDRLNHWVQNSASLKLFTIGCLVILLLIPTSFLTDLIREREDVRDNAVTEVSSKWGSDQILGGPIISIPYYSRVKNEKGEIETYTEYAHFLPENIMVDGNIIPEKRYRGIYIVVLYNSILHVKGKFTFPELEKLSIATDDFLLNDAVVSIGITDLKGVREQVNLKWNQNTLAPNPGLVNKDIFASGMHYNIALDKNTKEYSFEYNIDLNGSSSLHFLPFGKETMVNLHSTWNNPSFEGSFLPDNRVISDSGFTASWKVLHLNRNYSQYGTGPFIDHAVIEYSNVNTDMKYAYAETVAAASSANAASPSNFGVRLLLPVDEYQKIYRSVKYCIMFILITFLTFFSIEILNKKRIHPVQYLLVGMAICLFYVLLLALSEHIGFSKAYWIGSAIILLLLSYYVWFVFQHKKLTALFSFVLLLLYLFFYSLLQLQDYALLLGSTGLLVILAIVMFITRKVNWYEINNS